MALSGPSIPKREPAREGRPLSWTTVALALAVVGLISVVLIHWTLSVADERRRARTQKEKEVRIVEAVTREPPTPP